MRSSARGGRSSGESGAGSFSVVGSAACAFGDGESGGGKEVDYCFKVERLLRL